MGRNLTGNQGTSIKIITNQMESLYDFSQIVQATRDGVIVKMVRKKKLYMILV